MSGHRVDDTEWSPEAVERFWDNYASGDDVVYFARMARRPLLDLVEQSIGRPTSALDYGCGPGHLAAEFVARGVTTTGLDTSPGSVATANDRLDGRPGWQGAFLPDRLPERSFELVTCLETLEHLPDGILEDTLATIRGHLAPGGHAVFTTPNDEDLSASRMYCPFCDQSFHSIQHVRAFDEAALRSTVERAGFRIAVARSVNFWAVGDWPPVRWDDVSARTVARHLRRAWYRRRGAPPGDSLLVIARA